MDATKLKYLAAVSMLLDHAAVLLLSPGSLPWQIPRIIGRLAFPIFAWFVAEGLWKTGNRKKYLLRLGLFALIAQGPYLLAFWSGRLQGSVLATLFLAAGAMTIFETLREKAPLPTALLPLLAALLLASVTGCDYGGWGVALVGGFYLLGEDRRGKLRLLGVWSGLVYLLWQPLLELLTWLPAGPRTPRMWDIVARFGAESLPFYIFCALFACLSIPLLAHYNGERGTGHKWFFYWFYPLHLLALFFLAGLLAG